MAIKKYAYFLPQFYPTPENDKYWGKDFTEWSNVKSAKSLYKNHKQPIRPAKFGYYNLLEDGSFERLCDYSIEKGIDGFGYWHYWFGNGHQTLEKVPELHLKNRDIKQNFYFSWANTNWTKSWVGKDTLIFSQEYSAKDANNHFEYLQKFIEDDRYIKIDGKPLIQVLKPNDPGCENHILIIDNLMQKTFGVQVKWMFPSNNFLINNKLDILISGFPPGEVLKQSYRHKLIHKLNSKVLKRPTIVNKTEYLNLFEKNLLSWVKYERERYIPSILSGWDNTPRYGIRGFVIDADIHELLSRQFEIIKNTYESDGSLSNPQFILIKAFNEWAEGNIMEPYLNTSDKYFEPIKASLIEYL